MELVTGRAGSPHITSQQDRQKHQGIWGDGAYILATGNQLEPQVQSSNKILIKDGALMFQGALFSVKVGTTDEITINNGNQGMQRKDLVVARYTYDSAQQIESAEWVVIQGEPAESNPVAPSSTSGDIQEGDTTVDCPFMIVNLDGINVTGVDIIPEVAPDIPTLNASLSELIGNLNGNELNHTLYGIDSSAWGITFSNCYRSGRTVYFSGEWHQKFSGGLAVNKLYTLNNVSEDGSINDSDPSIRPNGNYPLSIVATDASYTHAVAGYAMIMPTGRIQYSFSDTPPNPVYLFLSGTYRIKE